MTWPQTAAVSPIGAPYPTEPCQRPVAGPVQVPPGPWPPDAGLLVVQTGFHRLAVGMWRRPFVTVDGHRFRARWGQNTFVLPPGTRWVMVGGPGTPAMTTVEIVPGMQTVLHYASPLLIWDRGRLAPVPQRSPHVAGFVVCLLLPIMMILLGRLLTAWL